MYMHMTDLWAGTLRATLMLYCKQGMQSLSKDVDKNQVKVACWLHVGAQLVPVLAFGENDVWHARQVKEGKLHEIQEAVKR